MRKPSNTFPSLLLPPPAGELSPDRRTVDRLEGHQIRLTLLRERLSKRMVLGEDCVKLQQLLCDQLLKLGLESLFVTTVSREDTVQMNRSSSERA